MLFFIEMSILISIFRKKLPKETDIRSLNCDDGENMPYIRYG